MKRSRLIRKTPLSRSKMERKRQFHIRRVSVKRKSETALYRLLRIEYLIEHPFCEGLCGKRSTEIHHRAGREGKLLNDKRHFAAVCRTLHDWIRDHPNQAREAGLLYEIDSRTGRKTRR